MEEQDAGARRRGTRRGESPVKNKLVAAIAVVALGWLAWDSFYIINETQRGVLTHFGRIAPPERPPGFHLKWPRPISTIYKVDYRVQTMGNLPHELITEDQKSVRVDGYLMWQVVDPIMYVEAIRTDESALAKLHDLYLSAFGVVISNRSQEAFISLGLEHEDVDEASEEILARIAPISRDNYGIEVLRAGIVEYTLPAENRPSIIQRMISERARIATKYRSEGEEAAIRIEALAIEEHDRIMADAHAEATVILGEAEAEAMGLLGQAYNADPDFYTFIRALDSYDLIIDRNTTLMLPADNELFRYLDSNEIPESE